LPFIIHQKCPFLQQIGNNQTSISAPLNEKGPILATCLPI
jgi:hypothetical protein